MGQHAAGVRDEQRQQLELLRRQPDLFGVAMHAVPIEVNRERATREPAVRNALTPDRSAECGSYPRHQLLGTEWLGHVIVSPMVERGNLVLLGPARRQNHD